MMKCRIRIIFLAILGCLMVFAGCKQNSAETYSIDDLPQDGVYSETEGEGGSYKDPIHSFFVVEPPAGFIIEEKFDKATLTVQPGRPRAGEKIPRSWIQFKHSNIQIGVIARETWGDLETDFNYTLDLFKAKGAKIQMERYVTIDGVKGGESILTIQGMLFHSVKYKKYGLDHSISISGPLRDCQRYQKQFIDFLRAYRGLKLE